MKFNKIQPGKGEILSTTMYMEVLSKDKDGIQVKDSFGNSFVVKGPQLIENTMNSSAQYDKEEKVSRTAAVEALLNAGDTVFQVEFVKQDGTDRNLVGRLVNTENHMGRSNVEDLLTTDAHKLRQVDHRTVKSVIVKGTKYVVKGK
jgi:hypothetical protein